MEGGGLRVDNAYWVEDQGMEGGRVEMQGGRRIVGGGSTNGGWRVEGVEVEVEVEGGKVESGRGGGGWRIKGWRVEGWRCRADGA